MQWLEKLIHYHHQILCVVLLPVSLTTQNLHLAISL